MTTDMTTLHQALMDAPTHYSNGYNDGWQAALATAPAWHPAPTVPGLWLANQGEKIRALDAFDIEHMAKHPWPGRRWYGPIPQEPAP